ncbi:hypothetical protein N656DRAFT_706694 [Canariomyces notabilis]|uniref:Uncharacterized protein n=1 Tax=Canariomyces notabilis TaxID=2074819 RepID=A0AAN6TFV2_9PEZI|nr:hypothetical protein N656DRAFT_706694 [Canariomyces arenarius]
MSVQIVPGFSLTNRLILYASLLLSPAQFVSGLGNPCPSNIGFLAYNLYTQIAWHKAVTGDSDIHALSLILPHFNLIYAVTYVGGVSSGSLIWGVPLGLGTTSVLILNTVSSWKAWAVHQPRGYGVYQFFFYGWRTIDEDFHKYLFLLWHIFDSLWCAGGIYMAIFLAITMSEVGKEARWYRTYLAIPLGSIGVLVFLAWPLILWTELIIARNQIVSETDMTAVWLFVAQVVTMLIPKCIVDLSCFRGKEEPQDSDSTSVV